MIAELWPVPLAELVGFLVVLLLQMQVPAVVAFGHDRELEELLFFLEVDEQNAVVAQGVADAFGIVGELRE